MGRLIDFDLRPDRRTLRQFGFIACVGFGLLALLAWLETAIFGFGLGEARIWLAATLGGLGLLSALLSAMSCSTVRIRVTSISLGSAASISRWSGPAAPGASNKLGGAGSAGPAVHLHLGNCKSLISTRRLRASRLPSAVATAGAVSPDAPVLKRSPT